MHVGFADDLNAIHETNGGTLIAAGLRDSVKICVGGAPVTLAYCQQIGADIYEPDAITLAQRLLDLSS